ncbi:head GIN domain-containing protein [Janthinobacterium sp.]|uniref:head GIN domain-containing protein n=1 Tax=Janthinobacterium sp. TaxID=1871054 RepID=UPI00293D58B6|nr:head GIN domain-containing protein [Janthinobacterium sp.]
MTLSTSPARRRLALGALALAAALPAAASPLDWFSSAKVSGNGAVHRQTRALPRFEAIALNLPGSVELRLGDSESISVETDDNLQAQIETVVEHGTLRIRPARRNATLAPTVLKFIVQAKSVERLTVGGSGSISAAALSTPTLQLEVGGSGSITIRRLRSDAVTVSIGGSGNFTAGGAAEQLNIAIGGSGEVLAGQLNTRKVQVNIGGSGKAVVWARQSLVASIGGSGDIDYYGDPQVSRSVHGSGGVNRLGAAPRQD